jgi:hypothetical protein
MADSIVTLNGDALDDLLNTPDGPVGETIGELSEKATDIAKAAAPVMQDKNRSHWGTRFDPLYQYGPAGMTKASVRSSGFRFNAIGQMYTGVNVEYGPTLFLERPARQIHSVEYMFMSAALDALEL